MYVISLDHYLDGKGAIAIKRGPGRKMADFVTSAVAYASNRHRAVDAPQPTCFECRNPKEIAVEVSMTKTGLVTWRCHVCGSEGQVSNWQGTFWDLSASTPMR